MFCFEVSLNNELKFVSGHEHMEKMRFSLYLNNISGPLLYVVDADLKPGESHTDQAYWHGPEPKINDEIKIKIVECTSPNKPSRLVTRGTKQDTNGNNLLYCSICGKSQTESKKIVRSKDVNVCNECVELLVEICNEA